MRQIILAVLILAGITAVTHAQKRYDELTYPKLDQIKTPDINTFKTDNGIKFYMIEDHELPLIDMYVMVRTGGAMVANKKTGLASLMGTVMRSGGTQSIPADSLNVLLEDNAASMETGIGFSSGYASMNVLKKSFDKLLPVFVDLLQHPAFPKDKVELAKKQAKSAISRRNDNIDAIGARVFDQIIYDENSKYARTTEYKTINNIDRQDLVKFHDKNFTAKKMMIGIVGDFNTAAMKQKLQNAFSKIPAGPSNHLNFPNVDYNFKHTINFASKPDVDQSLVLMGHIGGMRDNSDYAKIQVMNQVLSGGFSGRLFQQVRTNLGLAYSVGGHYGMNSFYPGQFVIQVKTKSATTAQAIDASIKEVKKLQKNPISKKELQDAQAEILNSAVFHHDSYSKILNERLSNEYRGLPEDAYQQYLNGVRNTTVQDVQNMAQKYLHPDSLQILVVGNKDEIGDQLKKYGNVNTIDISIPQPGAGQANKAEKGDAQKGEQLLSKMAAAIIAPGTTVTALSLSGKITLIAQNQSFLTSVKMNYPDNVEQTLQTPNGKLTMTLKGGKATMTMGGQERSLPAGSAQVKSLKSTLNRSVVAIAMKADELHPQFLGTEKKDDTTYNKVSVRVADKDIILYLGQRTNLPAILQYQQFNPQQGKQVTVEDHYSNWTSNGGVNYPYTQVSIVDGTKQAEATYTNHEVNGGE